MWLVSTEFLLRIESVRRRSEGGALVFHVLNTSRGTDHRASPVGTRGEGLLLNSCGVSSLYQLVVIGRMSYNGHGQLNLKHHTSPY
jgi:hypothetical protein